MTIFKKMNPSHHILYLIYPWVKNEMLFWKRNKLIVRIYDLNSTTKIPEIVPNSSIIKMEPLVRNSQKSGWKDYKCDHCEMS